MFRTTNEGQGFQITFANDYRVSVQFSQFNYCSNKIDRQDIKIKTECSTAEVALVHPDGWLIDLTEKLPWWNGDTVSGWATPNEVAELIAYAEALPKK